jgi:hypothetical protein
VATAVDPTTEIFLVDGSLERLATGVGVLEWWGQPGLYKVRFRAGATQADQLVELAPGPAPLEVAMEVPFSSPVPLSGTTTSHEYHQAGAYALNERTDAVLGSGARLMVLVRDYDFVPGDEGPVAAGLTLHDADGRLLYSFVDGRAEVFPGQAAWGGAHLEMDPGTYRLRLQLEDRRVLEQAVVASPGWCTQVFLARAPQAGSRRPVPDLMGAGVLMARAGTVFDPSSPALRWTEALRRGLERGRPAMPAGGTGLEEIRAAARENPMLGILAAHVLLAGDPDARTLAGEIVGELDPAAQDHPDARAVRLALAPGSPVASYPLPPMLRGSWETVVAASVRQPLLIREDSLSARVAARTVPSGAWMVWQLPDEPAPDAAASAASDPAPRAEAAAHAGGPLLDRLQAMVSGAVAPGSLEPPTHPDLTAEEAQLLRMMWLNSRVHDAPTPAAAPPAPKAPKVRGHSRGFGASSADRPSFDGVRKGAFDGLDAMSVGGAMPAGAPMEEAKPEAAPIVAAPPPTLDEMVKTLQLPVTSIHGAARGLMEKLSRGR